MRERKRKKGEALNQDLGVFNPGRFCRTITTEQLTQMQAAAERGLSHVEYARILGITSGELALVMGDPDCRPFITYVQRLNAVAAVALIDPVMRKHCDPDSPIDVKTFDSLLSLHNAGFDTP